MAQRIKLSVIFNPISGRGRGELLAREVAARAVGKGCKVRINASQRRYSEEELKELLGWAEAAVICGGDGTLQALIDGLARFGCPVYLLPAGNESLFAKEFGMTADAELALERILARHIHKCHFAYANGIPFLHMASLGLDAQVIADIARWRAGPIGHRGYLLPTLRNIWRHKTPCLSLEVDGKIVIEDIQGYLIVANSCRYGAGFNFAPEASTKQPNLVARFIPYSKVWSFCAAAFASRLNGVARLRTAKIWTGQNFKVQNSDLSQPIQIDGELLGFGGLSVSLADKQLLVL